MGTTSTPTATAAPVTAPLGSVAPIAPPAADPFAQFALAPNPAPAPSSGASDPFAQFALAPTLTGPAAGFAATGSAAAPAADWLVQQARNTIEAPLNAAVDAYHAIRGAFSGVPELADKPVPFNTALSGPAAQFSQTYVQPAVSAVGSALTTPLVSQPAKVAYAAAQRQAWQNSPTDQFIGRLTGDALTMASGGLGAYGLVRGAMAGAAAFSTSAAQDAAESAAREAAARAASTAAPIPEPTMRATPEQMIAEGRGIIKSQAARDAAEPAEVTTTTAPTATSAPSAVASAPATRAATSTAASGEPSEVIEPAASGSQTVAAPSPVSGFGAAPVDRKARAQILSDVISPDADIRNSALDSDIPATQVETNAANASSTEGGAHLANTFTQELDGMRSYFGKLVDQTGSNTGTDEIAREQRGTLLAGAAEQSRDAMAAETSSLYDAANARAASIGPMAGKLQTFKALLSSQQNDWALQDKSAVWNALNDRVNGLGLGELGTGDVTATNALRKSLSGAYNYQTYHLTAPLIDALDNDVTSAAGSDIYQAGRELRTVRAQYLENNPATRKIMAAPRDPDGIQRPIALDDVGQRLTGAPSAQLGNYVQMLKFTAARYPRLAGSMSNALNALKSEYLNGVIAKGFGTEAAPFKFWNHKAVDKYLNEHVSGMAHVFTPADMQKIRLGHQAGDILRTDKQYAGAAGQLLGLGKIARGGMKLARAGAEHGIPEMLGAAHGGPVGAVVGRGIAAATGHGLEKLESHLSKRAVLKRFSNLRDVLAE